MVYSFSALFSLCFSLVYTWYTPVFCKKNLLYYIVFSFSAPAFLRWAWFFLRRVRFFLRCASFSMELAYLKSVPNVLSERVSMFGTPKNILQVGTWILGKSSHVCLRVIWLWMVCPWL